MISIIEDIKHRILSQQTTQYFINGAPGSGKSYALSQLALSLPDHLSQSVILGPYAIDLSNVATYCQWVSDEMVERCYLDDVDNMSTILSDVHSTWTWLSENIFAKDRRFIILLDIQSTDYSEFESVANFFSALRGLENTNSQRNFSLHHILTGYWDDVSLMGHYNNIQVSFPYTTGHNYKHWDGLTADDVIEIIPDTCSHPHLYGRVLHELTGGHARLIQDTLSQTGDQLQLERLLQVIREIAHNSDTTSQLLNAWQHLPKSALPLLTKMLLHRNIPIHDNIEQEENYLVGAGIATWKIIGARRYLTFKSWYAELVIRYHYADLGINDSRLSQLSNQKITPELQTLNLEAYDVIRDIEMSARNLVIIIQSHYQLNDIDILERYTTSNGEDSLLTSALNEQDNAQKRGLNTSINQTISYITTGQLAYLIKQIASDFKITACKDIGQAMLEVASIRNAVMHNQLIDEIALEDLYRLQAKIYHAFSELDKHD